MFFVETNDYLETHFIWSSAFEAFSFQTAWVSILMFTFLSMFSTDRKKSHIIFYHKYLDRLAWTNNVDQLTVCHLSSILDTSAGCKTSFFVMVSCGICFDIVCSSSLLFLVPQEGSASWLWHFLGVFLYICSAIRTSIQAFRIKTVACVSPAEPRYTLPWQTV